MHFNRFLKNLSIPFPVSNSYKSQILKLLNLNVQKDLCQNPICNYMPEHPQNNSTLANLAAEGSDLKLEELVPDNLSAS